MDRQLRSGSVTLLSGSRVYWMHGKRVLVGHEHLMLHGFGRELALADINKNHIEHFGKDRVAKKRKTTNDPDFTIRELAGQGVVLPELAMILIPLVYLLDSTCADGLHTHPLPPMADYMSELDCGKVDVVLDPMTGHLPRGFPDDHQQEDCDEDEDATD